jgi:hypothetical protein
MIALFSLLLEWTEGAKFSPMLKVYLISGAPVFVLREERVLRANYFTFEIGSKGWVIFRKS